MLIVEIKAQINLQSHPDLVHHPTAHPSSQPWLTPPHPPTHTDTHTHTHTHTTHTLHLSPRSLFLDHGKPLVHFQSCWACIQTHGFSLSLSLSLFPRCGWPKPASRSHAMCSLSSKGAQLFAGGTQAGARMNEWHSGDPPGRQPTAGMELRAVLGRGVTACCCVICLR